MPVGRKRFRNGLCGSKSSSQICNNFFFFCLAFLTHMLKRPFVWSPKQ